MQGIGRTTNKELCRNVAVQSEYMQEHVVGAFVITTRNKVPQNYGFTVMDTVEARQHVLEETSATDAPGQSNRESKKKYNRQSKRHV